MQFKRQNLVQAAPGKGLYLYLYWYVVTGRNPWTRAVISFQQGYLCAHHIDGQQEYIYSNTPHHHTEREVLC